jgi:fatty-acyl-CoA synthase
VSWLPLYHDMGFIACLNMPLVLGVHTIMIDPIEWVTDPRSTSVRSLQHGGTVSWHPNFAYAFMAQRVRDSSSTRSTSRRCGRWSTARSP